jgi:hypothetical protein
LIIIDLNTNETIGAGILIWKIILILKNEHT